jgi:negative regulator of flagellin synthesis FlgM
MRINGINNVNNVYKKNKVKNAYGTSNISKGKDTFAISELAKEVQVAKKAVDKVSDIRENKVNDIKAKIEAGTYNISASDIADKILNNL